MNAAFSSWQAFFDMGGYAFYVWLSVAATLISLIALVAHTMVQRRQILDDVRRRQARERRIVQSKRNPTNESPAATKPAVPRLKPDASGEKLL